MFRQVFMACVILHSLVRGQILEIPESPRVLGMAGAYVALADDPQAGLLNPGGISLQSRMSYDGYFATSTHGGTDHFALSMANPRDDAGSAIGTGVWTQGFVRQADFRYYVPYAGTGWNPLGIVRMGSVLRLPVRDAKADSIGTKTFALVDLSLMKEYRTFAGAVLIERFFGGAGDDMPRALRWGTSSKPGERVSLCYEWRSEKRERDFRFHHASSRIGVELRMGKFSMVRGGYIWAAQHRFTFGASAGTTNVGWRLEGGWELPTSGTGETRWSVGLAYRFFGQKSLMRDPWKD